MLRARPLRASLRERGKPGAQAWLLDIATVLPVLPQGNWRTAPGGAQPLALDTGHDRNDTDRFERGWIAKPSRSLVLAARNFCGTTMTRLPFSNRSAQISSSTSSAGPSRAKGNANSTVERVESLRQSTWIRKPNQFLDNANKLTRGSLSMCGLNGAGLPNHRVRPFWLPGISVGPR